jgi:hypothetical protein
MRYDDRQQLYTLGMTCSDGTFIGSAGLYSNGTNVAVVTTPFDGFLSIRVALRKVPGLDAPGWQPTASNATWMIMGASFKDRNSSSTAWYGLDIDGKAVEGDNCTDSHNYCIQTTMCGTEQRIVGLATRSADFSGKLGSFIALCGKADGEHDGADCVTGHATSSCHVVLHAEVGLPLHPAQRPVFHDMCAHGPFIPLVIVCYGPCFKIQRLAELSSDCRRWCLPVCLPMLA